MLKNERQNEILDILKKNSFATVANLAKSLYASLPTIRRDLTLLEEEGYIKRCHGGAMILDGNTKPPLYFRREQNAQEKLKMCKVASSLISEGDTVFLDASSSVFHISDFLEKKDEVTVITNGLPLATRLADTGIKVYSTGGRLLRESLAFVGISAENSAMAYNADIMIFSVASLSDSGMLSDWSEDEAMLRLAMAKNAKKTVLLCDSSKFGTTSTFKLFPISHIDFLVTDKELPKSIQNSFELTELSSAPAYLYSVKHNT
jgi:DeoR family fructose operon transcriptional repressor